SGADRSTLRRGRGRGARQGVLLWADVPRREIEDPAPPDGVLDGRARGGLERLRSEHEAAGGLHLVHRGPLDRPPEGGARGARAGRDASRGGAAAVPQDLVYG